MNRTSALAAAKNKNTHVGKIFLVIFVICSSPLPTCIHARPGKVGCDLLGESGLNVMERSIIMNEKTSDVNNLIFKENVELVDASRNNDDQNVVISLRLRNLKRGGGVIHTSSGNLRIPSSFAARFTEKKCEHFEKLRNSCRKSAASVIRVLRAGIRLAIYRAL